MNKDIRYKIEGVSRNVVNQLYDLAEVPVKKRQSINDTADEFVIKLISQLLRSTLKDSLERVRLKEDTIFPGPRDVDGARSDGYNQAVRDLNEKIDAEKIIIDRLQIWKTTNYD